MPDPFDSRSGKSKRAKFESPQHRGSAFVGISVCLTARLRQSPLEGWSPCRPTLTSKAEPSLGSHVILRNMFVIFERKCSLTPSLLHFRLSFEIGQNLPVIAHQKINPHPDQANGDQKEKFPHCSIALESPLRVADFLLQEILPPHHFPFL